MEDAAKGRLYIPFAASFYVIGKCVLRQKNAPRGSPCGGMEYSYAPLWDCAIQSLREKSSRQLSQIVDG